MISPSIKTVLYAHALASWVEGTSQLRSYLLSPPQLALEQPLDTAEEDEDMEELSVRQRLVRWLKSSGRASDEADGALFGGVQMITALALLRSLRVRPLLPILLTPVLAAATVPVPAVAALLGHRRRKYGQMALTVGCLAVLHEALRACVAAASQLAVQRRKELAGTVILKGTTLPEQRQYHDDSDEDLEDDDERDQQCIICAAPGTGHLPRSNSTDSLASMASSATGAWSATLGPLEAFCSTAPFKHLAHRQCFMAWRAAHVQTYGIPAVLSLVPSRVPQHASSSRTIIVDHGDEVSDFELLTARSLLRAAPTELSNLFFSVVPEASRLTQTRQASEKPTMRLVSSSGTPPCAEITSQSPPCPLCRATTTITLETVPPHPSAISAMTPRRMWDAFVCAWRHLVSGRTIGARVLGEGAFLWALLSIMRVREKAIEQRLLAIQVGGPKAVRRPVSLPDAQMPREGSWASRALSME